MISMALSRDMDGFAVEKAAQSGQHQRHHGLKTLPSRRKQMAFPFILQEKLGPLPETHRQTPVYTTNYSPATTAAYSPIATAHRAIGASMPADAEWSLYPTSINTTNPYYPVDHGRRQTMTELSIPILPPPLPTYPRPNSSPGFRPPPHQLPSPNAAYRSTSLEIGTSEYQRLEASSRRTTPESTASSFRASPHVAMDNGAYMEPIRYKCDQCVAAFLSNGALKRHRKVHVERNFHCQCGAAYTERSILRVRPVFPPHVQPESLCLIKTPVQLF